MDFPFSSGSSQYVTLTAMITPAIFMTACGSLIISTSNRMSRVIDRIRALNDLMDRLRLGKTDLDFIPERVKHFNDQLEYLEWRGERIRIALAQLYAAMGAFVGTSLTVAVDVWTSHALGPVPTILAAAGVLLLMGACIQLFREARVALQRNREEVLFYRKLRNLDRL